MLWIDWPSFLLGVGVVLIAAAVSVAAAVWFGELTYRRDAGLRDPRVAELPLGDLAASRALARAGLARGAVQGPPLAVAGLDSRRN